MWARLAASTAAVGCEGEGDSRIRGVRCQPAVLHGLTITIFDRMQRYGLSPSSGAGCSLHVTPREPVRKGLPAATLYASPGVPCQQWHIRQFSQLVGLARPQIGFGVACNQGDCGSDSCDVLLLQYCAAACIGVWNSAAVQSEWIASGHACCSNSQSVKYQPQSWIQRWSLTLTVLVPVQAAWLARLPATTSRR